MDGRKDPKRAMHLSAHQFKKGVSGNPSGRPKLPDRLKGTKPITTDELKYTIAKHFKMDEGQIEGVLSNPQSISLDLIIAATIKRAYKDGDIAKAEYLFMRSLGKVTEKIELQHPEPVVITRPNGEQVLLGVEETKEEFEE